MGDRRTGRLGAGLLILVLLVALLAPLLAPWDPAALTGPSLGPPSAAHPLGTDAIGRDLLSAIIYGARTSLLIAVSVGALTLAIGGALGLASGYLGRPVDDIIMRGTELFQVVPRFFLAVTVIALFGPGLDRIIGVLALTSWPLLARVVRAEVLTLKHREFVRAAEAIGASRWRIVWRRILPNALPAALVVLGLLLGQVLLIESSLGFIGLGDPNVVSWGGLAGQATGYLRVAWWLPLFPGLAIAITVLGFNLLADGMTKGRARR